MEIVSAGKLHDDSCKNLTDQNKLRDMDGMSTMAGYFSHKKTVEVECTLKASQHSYTVAQSTENFQRGLQDLCFQ